ncbi:MAG: T9SS type A sorting domain-containing protein [Rhodothermales bacterium]|nr:T9SS type A sorting domain-containing protein [Rhodothermales bacterium]
MFFAAIQHSIKKALPGLLAIGCLIVFPASLLMNQAGAPAMRTGAPGDGDGTPGNSGSCADAGCHNTYPVNSGIGSVTIDAPAEFLAGVPLEFMVSVEDTSRFRFGFQTTIKTAAAENVGTFELIDSNTRFATGNSNYVTHTLANSNAQWTVRWTPPAELTEDVTIYAGGNAADGRFTPASDYTYETEVLLQFAQPSGIDDQDDPASSPRLEAFPNPASSIVSLVFESGQENDARLQVFDLLGKIVYEAPSGPIASGQTIDVNVTNFPAGVYIGKLIVGTRSISTTFSVVK